MQRDMDLVRALLLKIEEYPDAHLPSQPVISGWSNADVNYHIGQLLQAEFISATVFRGGNEELYANIALLWKGHDFLAAARDNTIWKKAKTKLGGAFNTITIALLQEFLVNLMKESLFPKP